MLTNGTVVGWGDNGFGQASPPSNLSNVVAITAGDLHSAALCSNGTVVVWGDDTFGQTNVPPGLSNVVALAAGDFHTLALLSNGTIVAWGNNTYGQLDVPPSATNALAITSGYYHGLALVPFISLLHANLTRGGLISQLEWNRSSAMVSEPRRALHRNALSRQPLDKCGHVCTSKILPRAAIRLETDPEYILIYFMVSSIHTLYYGASIIRIA